LSILSKNNAIIVILITIYLHAELNNQWPINNNNDDEDNGNNKSSLLTTEIKVIPAFNATRRNIRSIL
jgi:dolichyl-phosphate-mannose--protein O-mannosyl transferase